MSRRDETKPDQTREKETPLDLVEVDRDAMRCVEITPELLEGSWLGRDGTGLDWDWDSRTFQGQFWPVGICSFREFVPCNLPGRTISFASVFPFWRFLPFDIIWLWVVGWWLMLTAFPMIRSGPFGSRVFAPGWIAGWLVGRLISSLIIAWLRGG